jgi:photosynthetic reaction center H subunit
MARMTIEPNEDGVRIAPLGALDDFQVAEGYPDVRGWKVLSSDGEEVGKVHELLIDVDNLRTRYLDVRLTQAIAATPGDRDVLVPIGTAHIVDDENVVRVPLSAERIGLLPLYDHKHLTRVHELEVRRHFSLGEAAAAAATGAVADTAQRTFYDDEGYDDRKFFGRRDAALTDDERAARRAAERPGTNRELAEREGADRERADRERADRERADREFAPRDQREADRAMADRVVMDRDIRTREGEVRVPVQRDESVVLKRGEGGRDEIIIRRPLDERSDRAG